MIYKHLVNFWPLVPAIDLQALARNRKSDEDVESTVETSKELGNNSANKELNCLIIGDGIGCLVETLSHMHKHKANVLNFYVSGSCPESLTRVLLLLSLCRDMTPKISLLERAEMFLEIFGNSLLRRSTAAYVEEMSQTILGEITSEEHDHISASMVFKKYLKQRDIDEIVEVLTYLKDKEKSYCVENAWDSALRTYYRTRYDNRRNLFDYNFNMKLEKYPIINIRKYIEWCETGTAFKFRKAKFNVPNKTLCIRKFGNRNKFVKGDEISKSYFGDIATSPYLTFGVECSNKDFFKKVNNEYVQTSEDISKYNLLEMLSEFRSQSEGQNIKFNIYLMFLDSLLKSLKIDSMFDIIYITCDSTGYGELLLPKFLRQNGVVIFESIENVVNSTKEQKQKHLNEISRIAKELGLKKEPDFAEFASHQVFSSYGNSNNF
ncbi:dynein axonemal assembly factor 3-like [Uloborus diversus]|uniref:dynein axonemal assembly factor 3-like n=1 Tax=Uloborus diversus TaxID=327109 RepID=UPI002409CDF8|nr:dynein axonemal assembly factor 3-like [Uloborus diversus]